ncbi:hypothetical protein [Hirschia baltica]|uniref:Uncharacterized protein n=1 Tax=Hirschia baltica (strain ATCC 49814 / DSM 5838 / IFAM 1418) TaxID=582402 RepID=C6XR24_HIRBI|nr:hypothetical protein [Hirschia baltica]ACT60555.1 hypothetical protein Hbal_2884 [Hirschia baltica ATCC 49814]
MPLARDWTGKIYGTNNGGVYLSIEDRSDQSVVGHLNINDEQCGVSIYKVSGTFNGSEVHLSGEPVKLPEGIEAGSMHAKGILTAQGGVDGTWSTVFGSAGTFWLVPHGHSTQPDGSPDQLFTARKDWGPIEITRDDIVAVAELIQKDFNNPVVVTVTGETEVSCYLERFKGLELAEQRARIVKIRGADPERDGINRVVQVEFGPQMNFAFAQSTNEAWARGKKEMLAQHLKKFERNYATYIKRLGLGTNQLLHSATLVVLPALPDWSQRAFLVVIVMSIALALAAFDRHIMRFASIWIADKPNLAFGRSFISWVVNVFGMIVAALAAAAIGGWLP